ncbi:alpha/beta hydrolase, partial [Pseudomonas sp. TYF_14]|uniref:alpha/beta hydrolase n=1 Tax=Pseudomonas sp. TYF_14 TaxID=3367193 RepID=UPI003709E408
KSDQVRAEYPRLTIPYGSKPSEKMDVFAPAQTKDLPVMIFIHGGAWRHLSKEDSAGPAPSFVDSGVIYVALDFDVIPKTDLPGMVSQCREAIKYVSEHARDFGGDPAKIFVSGHSSGGHLAAMMLTTDWKAQGAPADVLKGGVVLSGMGDLKGPMLSARGEYLKLNNKQISEFSPLEHMSRVKVPVIVGWGGAESPEFVRQNKEMAEALAHEKKLYWQHEFANVDHYSVVNELNDPASALFKKTLELIKSR